MQKLHFSMFIQAPKEKVWHALFEDQGYREWTKAFNPDSRYQGDWTQGSKMLFLGVDPKTGEQGGMVSQIAKNTPYEYMSIQHMGILKNGMEDTTSEEAKKWAPAFENYSFVDKDGGTEVQVDMDSVDEYVEMFTDMWPQGFQKLKEIAKRA